MFDQQQEKLLEHSLFKIQQEFKKNSNVYGVSGFDQNFDQDLRMLVLHYSFDFDAVALHLYFKYPQYAHRLKPQAVSYRWYQLTMQKQGESIQKAHEVFEIQYRKRNRKEGRQMEVENVEEGESQEEDIAFFSIEEKLLQYETAMMKALELDEEENQSFMLYKPKFIMDTEFKLERESSDDAKHLSALVQNQVCFQFGQFQQPQAAPLPQMLLEKAPSMLPTLSAAPEIKEQEQTYYMDEDWQQYQSD